MPGDMSGDIHPGDIHPGDPHPGESPADGIPEGARETQPQSEPGGPDAGPADASGGDGPAGASPAGDPPVGDDRAQAFERELEALRAEHEALRGQYMRMAADFDNFRKRQSRDLEDLRHQIAAGTLSEILPVVDNFDRARQQLNPQHEEAQALHRSYQGLYKQLVDVFKQLGVAPMRVEGEPFDPSLHEAVLREPSHDHPEDVVTEELQRGYQLNGRVLRHALVKVSMGPGPAGESAAEEQGG
jgi:molecular chaperone GrpE